MPMSSRNLGSSSQIINWYIRHTLLSYIVFNVKFSFLSVKSFLAFWKRFQNVVSQVMTIEAATTPWPSGGLCLKLRNTGVTIAYSTVYQNVAPGGGGTKSVIYDCSYFAELLV